MNPIRAVSFAVSALILMVEGIIPVAVANELVITHPGENPSAILSLLPFGGPILYLLAQGWFLWDLSRDTPRLRILGSVALVLIEVVSLTTPPYLSLFLVGVTLTIIALLDRQRVF